MPPRLDQAITGCPFRPRCDVVVHRCEAEHPALRPVGLLHEAACHRNDSGRNDSARKDGGRDGGGRDDLPEAM